MCDLVAFLVCMHAPDHRFLQIDEPSEIDSQKVDVFIHIIYKLQQSSYSSCEHSILAIHDRKETMMIVLQWHFNKASQWALIPFCS